MRDSRIIDALKALEEAHKLLGRNAFEFWKVTACLDEARTLIVDIVDECRMPYPKAVNHLDASRNFINSAIKLVHQGWAASETQVLVRSAVDQLEYAQQPQGAA